MRRPWLLPLGPVYAAGLRLSRRLQPVRRHLTRPVVSVGSLSAGGAGKTPLVRMLAELLARHGVQADVLSRGYGRGTGEVLAVDPAGTARQFGDEPLTLARAGIPVWVGAARYKAGVAAERDGRAQLHLLDDGFQHRQLARSLDIVLLTAEDAADHLLPTGNLREPFAALSRAQVIVLREEEAEALGPLVARHTRAETWVIRRKLVLPARRPLHPVVFCGIARPQGFLAMVRAAGCLPAGEMIFPDHHPYAELDARALVKRAQDTHADGFLTTGKDAVRLLPPLCAALERVGAVMVAELATSLVDESAALRKLLPLLRKAPESATDAR